MSCNLWALSPASKVLLSLIWGSINTKTPIIAGYMRALFFIFVIIFCGVFTAGAQTQPITLTGKLIMKTGEVFPYKVVLTDSEEQVNGYSMTYQEPDETRTTIHGTIDRHMRSLNFKEKDIIYSHNVSTKAFMCLVNASLEYVWDGGGYVLKGPITGREADNTACTQGEVIFNNSEELEKLFAYHEHFDTVISMKRRVRDTAAPVVQKAPEAEQPAADKTDQITAGVEKAYEWHSDTVIIDIWDGGHIDGDRVTLQYNGKQYLTNYCLQREKKRLKIPISGNETNRITILAENEGSEPPNTANIMLTDGITKYNILAYNKKGDVALISIRKVN